VLEQGRAGREFTKYTTLDCIVKRPPFFTVNDRVELFFSSGSIHNLSRKPPQVFTTSFMVSLMKHRVFKSHALAYEDELHGRNMATYDDVKFVSSTQLLTKRFSSQRLDEVAPLTNHTKTTWSRY